MATQKTKKPTSIHQLLSNVEHQKNKRLAEKEKSSKKTKIAKLVKSSNEVDKEAKLKNDILKFNEEGFIVVEEDDRERNSKSICLSRD